MLELTTKDRPDRRTCAFEAGMQPKGIMGYYW